MSNKLKIITIIITIIIIALKYLGRHLAGNSHGPRAGEALFSLGWQSPRDGVSIKILVIVQPKNH